MATLTVTLPEPLWAFVQEQAARAGHGSAEAYVQSLVREAQRQAMDTMEEDIDYGAPEHLKATPERLEAMLLEGIHSGPPIPVTEEYWEEKIRRRDETSGFWKDLQREVEEGLKETNQP